MSNIKIEKFDAADYLEDEETIAAYLSEAMEDDDPDILLSVLDDIARARGMNSIAEKTGLSRTSLYKALTPGAQPRFSTIFKIINALGVTLTAHPLKIEEIDTCSQKHQDDLTHFVKGTLSNAKSFFRTTETNELFTFYRNIDHHLLKIDINTASAAAATYDYLTTAIKTKTQKKDINLNVMINEINNDPEKPKNFDYEYDNYCCTLQ